MDGLIVVLLVVGARTPCVGCTELLKEALVVIWQANQVSFEALTVLALELQHQLGVCVEGGDSRCHAAGERNPGRARGEQKNWTVRPDLLTGFRENTTISSY